MRVLYNKKKEKFMGKYDYFPVKCEVVWLGNKVTPGSEYCLDCEFFECVEIIDTENKIKKVYCKR